SPDGRLLTFRTTSNETQLWDAAAGTEGALLDPHAVAVFLSPDGAWLFTSSGQGLYRWPVERQPGRVRVGPPALLWEDRRALHGFQPSADGHTLLALDLGSHQPLAFDLERKGGAARVLPHRNAVDTAISADGQWAATGVRDDLEDGQTWVNVWDLHQQ